MKQATIFVVEDKRSHAELIGAIFVTGLPDAQVNVAFSGEEARSYLLHEDPPDLITLDLSLPDTDGLEILEWLRSDERFADIPVIIFTSSSDPAHERRAYSLGVRRYLPKPAHFGVLADAVKEVLGPSMEWELDASTGG